MKRHLFAAALALCGLLSTTAQAAQISIVPSTSTHSIGDTFSLDVNISGLGSEIVSVFDLNIYFDSSVVTGTGYTLGSGLGGSWFDLSAANAGNFDLFAFSLTVDPSDPATDDALAALQTDGSFTLLTLNFEATGAGVSQVFFGSGFNERDVVGRKAQFIETGFTGACVAVNSPTGGSNSCDGGGGNNVPEPASFGLVAMAMLAAGFARRRAAA